MLSKLNISFFTCPSILYQENLHFLFILQRQAGCAQAGQPCNKVKPSLACMWKYVLKSFRKHNEDIFKLICYLYLLMSLKTEGFIILKKSSLSIFKKTFCHSNSDYDPKSRRYTSLHFQHCHCPHTLQACSEPTNYLSVCLLLAIAVS